MLTLTLPYPPTVNTYWRHPSRGQLAGRHLISDKGRRYRETVHALLPRIEALRGRLHVEIWLSPPDKRRRDLDNTLKSLLDAIGYAGIWQDDSQIDRLIVDRQEPVKGGSVQVMIRNASPLTLRELSVLGESA